MAFCLHDAKIAAHNIRELASTLDFAFDGVPSPLSDLRVRVRTKPPLIVVEFYFGAEEPQAGFTLIQQPNCCGVMISTKTFVAEKFREKGVAQAMMLFKEEIARQFGYSSLVATVNITSNPAEVHILQKFGWIKGYEFRNARTQNQVGFFHKTL